MHIKNPVVDQFFEKLQHWQEELKALRILLLNTQLKEELKWKQPCYTFQNKNVLLLGNFKTFCCISFFKGVVLKDIHNILVAPGDNSRTTRIIKFENLSQILVLESILKEYVLEAIEIEKSGIKIEKYEKTSLNLSEELKTKFSENQAFKEAFNALTPGRQRGYNIYFSAPKQSKSRISRIEKYVDRILTGKGINDCVCGHSKRMPNCDGSHKYVEQIRTTFRSD